MSDADTADTTPAAPDAPRRSWRQRLGRLLRPDLGAAITRFPLSAVATAIATVIAIILIERHDRSPESETLTRLAVAIFAGGIAALPGVLFGEARNWPFIVRQLLALALGAAAAIAVWFAHDVNMQPIAFYASLVLLTGLAPFVFRPRDNANYWAFNHDVWLGLAYAGIGGLLVALGASAIVATLDYLFGFEPPRELWAEIWVVAFLLVAPLIWLSVIPARFHPLPTADNALDGQPEQARSVVFTGITLLVKYILVPLLLVYTAILYAYAAKVLLAFELPRGRIGWMVSSFGVVGVVTALLAWPVRESGGAIVRFFWRHWFWLLLVPLVLLGIGTAERLNTYGLTQSRYLLVILGSWLGVLGLLYMLPDRRRDLRMIAGGFSVLLLLVSMGPFSLTAWPGSRLAAEMKSTLKEAGYTRDGKIVPENERGRLLRDSEKRRLSSIVRELGQTGQLGRVASIFPAKDTPFNADSRKSWNGPFLMPGYRHATTSAIRKRLGLQGFTVRKSRYVSFHASKPGLLRSGELWILGPLYARFPTNASKHRSGSVQRTGTGTDDVSLTWRVEAEGARVTFSLDGKILARIDLADIAKREFGDVPANKKAGYIVRTDNGVTFVVQNAQFLRDDDKSVRITSLNLTVLIPQEKLP